METANNWDDSSVFEGKEVETDQPGSPGIFQDDWGDSSLKNKISQTPKLLQKSQFTPSLPSASPAPFKITPLLVKKRAMKDPTTTQNENIPKEKKGNAGVKVDV